MRFSRKNAGLAMTCLHILWLLLDGLMATPLDKVEGGINHLNLVPGTVDLLKYENSNIGVDGYEFAFETSDGVSRKEKATVKNLGTDEEAISVEGSVSWVGPDGIQYTLNYLADENGFQPEGKHLPVAPDTRI